MQELLPNVRYHWGENKNMHNRKPIWGVGVYTTGLLVLLLVPECCMRAEKNRSWAYMGTALMADAVELVKRLLECRNISIQFINTL